MPPKTKSQERVMPESFVARDDKEAAHLLGMGVGTLRDKLALPKDHPARPRRNVHGKLSRAELRRVAELIVEE